VAPTDQGGWRRLRGTKDRSLSIGLIWSANFLAEPDVPASTTHVLVLRDITAAEAPLSGRRGSTIKFPGSQHHNSTYLTHDFAQPTSSREEDTEEKDREEVGRVMPPDHHRGRRSISTPRSPQELFDSSAAPPALHRARCVSCCEPWGSAGRPPRLDLGTIQSAAKRGASAAPCSLDCTSACMSRLRSPLPPSHGLRVSPPWARNPLDKSRGRTRRWC